MHIQFVISNSLDCEIYRSETYIYDEKTDFTRALVEELQEHRVNLYAGDTIKITELPE